MRILDGDEVISAMSRNVYEYMQRGIITELKALYKDRIPQGAEMPCIFFETRKFSHEEASSQYADWNFTVIAHCFPEEGQEKIESWGRHLGTKLIDCFRSIDIDGYAVKTKGISYRINMDVLEVTSDYSFKVRQNPDDDDYLMETLFLNNIRNK